MGRINWTQVLVFGLVVLLVLIIGLSPVSYTHLTLPTKA